MHKPCHGTGREIRREFRKRNEATPGNRRTGGRNDCHL
jgi:hypothetical protein